MTVNDKLLDIFNEDPTSENLSTEKRTLQYVSPRSLFDPLSAEWKEIGMEERVSLLRKIVNSQTRLKVITETYKREYRDKGREDIVEELENSLILILEHILSEKNN